MATRLKTVEYFFPMLTGLTDNTATNATQITIYLPESSLSFISCVVDVISADANTSAQNTNRRQIEFRLGAAAYSVVNNTNVITQSGEQYTFQYSGDFTSHFTSNWSGTSMTADCRILIDSAGTIAARNTSIRLSITYEFDDTSTIHLKTVHIPLNAPTSAMGNTKSTIYDTIPALDTYLPEASKTFRQLCIIIQGNTEGNNTTDKTISMEVDSLGSYTSELFECGLNTDVWYRVQQIYAFTTNTTHSLYLWASTTDFDHPQCWLVVTYEFDSTTTTSIMNSLLLPMEVDSPMGGPTSSDYQRGKRDLWIQETGSITTNRLAFFVFYDKLAAMAGLNARIGTGSFVSYTDVSNVLAGGCGFMIRNDSAFTLTSGRNTINADFYNTDTVDLGYNVSGFWMINYTSSVPSEGIWAANHTVRWNLKTVGTVAASVQTIISAISLNVPENDRFFNSIGVNYIYTSNTTGQAAGAHIGVERLVAEGGLIWETVYSDIGGTDPEVGIRQCWGTARSVFNRFKSGSVTDVDVNRLDLNTSRRWRLCLANSCNSYDHFDVYLTYHSMIYTVSGNISGSGGGTVTIYLCRSSNGERLMQTTRVGNGSYSFTWFDSTEEIYVTATESSSLRGVSKDSLAPASDMDINLSSGGSTILPFNAGFYG